MNLFCYSIVRNNFQSATIVSYRGVVKGKVSVVQDLVCQDGELSSCGFANPICLLQLTSLLRRLLYDIYTGVIYSLCLYLFVCTSRGQYTYISRGLRAMQPP